MQAYWYRLQTGLSARLETRNRVVRYREPPQNQLTVKDCKWRPDPSPIGRSALEAQLHRN